MNLDSRLSNRLAQFADQHHRLRRAAGVLAHSGDSPFWIVGLLLVLWFGSSAWQFESKVDLLGIGLTALVVQIIKWSVRRPRPTGEWGQGYRKLDPHSFPSGHAARAFVLATVALFLGPVWWAILLSGWAPFVALARVAMRVHYLSDVIVGALCGLTCGLGLGLWISF